EGAPVGATSKEPVAVSDDTVELLPRYKPMPALPTSNSTAVTAAPTHTSRQAMAACGMNLYMAANRTTVMPSEKAAFAIWSSTSHPGKRPLLHCPRAASKELAINE